MSNRRFNYILISILLFTAIVGMVCKGKDTRNSSQKNQTSSNQVEGLFVYWADAAILAECSSGEKLPVAMEKDYISLEKAYLDKRKEVAKPLLVRFEGHKAKRPAMEGDNLEVVFIVDNFLEILPDTICIK
jgi:uncharacterized lipoprotein NlpE involved in copper resistance